MVDKNVKELMDSCNISMENVEDLRKAGIAALDSFESWPREKKEQEFLKLMTADCSMHKLHEIFFNSDRNEIAKILDNDRDGVLGKVISVMACYTMVGANFGFMKSVDDEEAD